MLLLILCIAFSFGIAITLHNIINMFDTRCILGAQIRMIEIPSTDNVSTSEITSATVKLTEVYNQSYANFLATSDATEFPTSQVEFMVKRELQ